MVKYNLIKHYHNKQSYRLKQSRLMKLAWKNKKKRVNMLKHRYIPVKKVCKKCGITFIAPNVHRLYCDKHRNRYDPAKRNIRGLNYYWRQARKKVLAKMPVCKICGSNFRLNVHHKDENKKNIKLSNLITLCHSCHYKVSIIGRLIKKNKLMVFKLLKYF